MHVKFKIILLLVVLAGWTGCAKDELSSLEKEVVPVRILATIDFSFTGSAFRSGSITENNYTAGTDTGSVADRKITTIRVLAFDVTTHKTQVNMQFGTETSSADNKFTYSDGNFQLDLEIMSGEYEFYLIANEDAAWNLQNVLSKSGFNVSNYINPITSINELNLAVGIPMVGSSTFDITFSENTTPENPFLVQPVIGLKRTLSKIEVNLTNQDLATDSVIFSTAGVYEIKSVSLRNINQVYNIREDDATIVTESSPLQSLTNIISHVAGDPFTGTILTSYVAERENVGSENSMMVDVTVLKGSEEVAYSIPIWQYADDAVTKDYNIYRNTLYRVNCILKGTALTVSLNVLPWDVTTSYRDFDSSNTFTQMEFATVWNNDPATTPPMLSQPYIDETTAYSVAKFTFQLEYPQGGIWTATLTNGLDFAFRPGTPMMGTSGMLYTVEIVALKPQTTYARTTEFYLMVDGKEIDPDNYYEGVILRDGTVGIGPGNRFVITQSAR